jgi:hypothetical protein
MMIGAIRKGGHQPAVPFLKDNWFSECGSYMILTYTNKRLIAVCVRGDGLSVGAVCTL